MAESDKEMMLITLKPYLADNKRSDNKMQNIAIDLILTICFQMGYNYYKCWGGFPFPCF